LFDSFVAFAECSLEQIKSGLWPTHLFRQITGAVTAYSYDGTKSSAIAIIHPLFLDFNGRKNSLWRKCFLLMVLAIPGCIVVVNGGELVVNCVVNVDSDRTLLWSLKVGHAFEVYF
jgi:hypothetical protein